MKKIFEFGTNRRLVITENALRALQSHKQESRKQSEAGGAMLGRHLNESPDIVIDELTVPQAQDLRSRFSFFRSSQHSSVATERWKASVGKIAYLGLWHTHPERVPSPSGVDMKDWANAIRKDTYEGDYLFFIIVGTENIGVWSGNRNLEFKELKTSYDI